METAFDSHASVCAWKMVMTVGPAHDWRVPSGLKAGMVRRHICLGYDRLRLTPALTGIRLAGELQQ